MNFKEFLLEDDTHTEVNLKQAIDFIKNNCSDFNLKKPLWRVSSNETSTISKTRKRERFKGKSGAFSEAMLKMPEWKDYPDRSKSIFCSSSKTIRVPGSNKNLIIPVNNTVLACVNDDFNFLRIKVNFEDATRNLTLPEVVEELVDFGNSLSDGSNAEKFEKAINWFKELDSLKGKKRLEKIEWVNSSGYVNYVIKAFINHNSDIYKKFTPEELGVRLTNSNEYSSSRVEEVWFEGRYLSLTQDMYKEIMIELKK